MSGGAFNQSILQYSDNTKNLVKELIRQSGVNTSYQRDVERSLHHSAPLPAVVNGTSEEGSSKGADASKRCPKYPILWRGKRTKQQIEEIVQKTPPNIFVPKLPKYDKKSKERCQDLMANEGDLPNYVDTNGRKKTIQVPLDDRPGARTVELIKEIDERVAWLSSLEKLGAADEYRAMTLSEIATRLRDLEFLDAAKCHLIKKKHKDYIVKPDEGPITLDC